MSKCELFDAILRLVSCETEVPAEHILSGKKDTETVDARYLLVHFLIESGFTPSYIASKIGATQRTVCYIHTNFEIRYNMQKMLRIQTESIRKQMGKN